MFLAAQRVISICDGSQGINAFCYLHEPEFDAGLDAGAALDQPPGKLVRERVRIPPPGNRVRSFLDVVGPNQGTVADIRVAFGEFLRVAAAEGPLPWTVVSQQWAFRFLCDNALAPVWEREAEVLFEAIAEVLSQGNSTGRLPQW